MSEVNNNITKNMKKAINVRLRLDLIAKLHEAADEQQRTITVIVEKALNEYFNKEANK